MIYLMLETNKPIYFVKKKGNSYYTDPYSVIENVTWHIQRIYRSSDSIQWLWRKPILPFTGAHLASIYDLHDLLYWKTLEA